MWAAWQPGGGREVKGNRGRGARAGWVALQLVPRKAGRVLAVLAVLGLACWGLLRHEALDRYLLTSHGYGKSSDVGSSSSGGSGEGSLSALFAAVAPVLPLRSETAAREVPPPPSWAAAASSPNGEPAPEPQQRMAAEVVKEQMQTPADRADDEDDDDGGGLLGVREEEEEEEEDGGFEGEEEEQPLGLDEEEEGEGEEAFEEEEEEEAGGPSIKESDHELLKEEEEKEEEAEGSGADDDDGGLMAGLDGVAAAAYNKKQEQEEALEREVEAALEAQDEEDEAEEDEAEEPAAATTAVNEPELEQEEDEEVAACLAAGYGTRHFLPKGTSTKPTPVLYSFPGSGNTWTRLLIDYATGVFTGSIYRATGNRSNAHLPGQGHCHQRVSVVKAHPNNFRPAELFSLASTGDIARCRKSGGIEGFERFVLLTRNPFDAIWSEYRRRTNAVLMQKSRFDLRAFRSDALQLAEWYVEMTRDFHAVRQARPAADVLNLRYEDWLDMEGDRRLGILGRLTDFIGLPPVDDDNGEEADARARRLRCAFALAEHASGGRRGAAALKSMDAAEAQQSLVTAEDAYPPRVACPLWDVLRPVATALGYGLPAGVTEADCRELKAAGSSAAQKTG